MRKILLSILAATAVAVALSLILPGLLPSDPEWIGHLASHGSAGVPFSIAAIYSWRQKDAPRSLSSRAILIGMTGIGLAQLIEAASARIEYPGMGPLHGISGLLTILSMAVGMFGLIGLAIRSIAGRQVSMPGWAIALSVIGGLAALVMLAKIIIGF